jgi:hypothetical protein
MGEVWGSLYQTREEYVLLLEFPFASAPVNAHRMIEFSSRRQIILVTSRLTSRVLPSEHQTTEGVLEDRTAHGGAAN